jgi:glycosyltransferase involved in cell wall biosynthesis
MPRVSVIIPTNSRPHMLVRAVQSAERAGSGVEVIVVDDASTDQTAEVCQTLQGIKYIRLEQNQGVAGARNVGILASSSDYVAFLDDDDLRLPGTLDKQLEVLMRDKQVGFVCAQMLMADQEGRLTGEVTGPKSSGGESAFWELLELDFPVMPISVVIRKECFTSVGLFNANLSGIDDWDLFVRIAELYPVLVLNEPVSIYRKPTPYSDQGSSNQAQHLSRALHHQLELLRLPRVKMAPLAQQKEIRRRMVNRIVDTLLWNAARAIPQGANSFACRNIFAALRLSPSRTLRDLRPQRLARVLKASSVRSNTERNC